MDMEGEGRSGESSFVHFCEYDPPGNTVTRLYSLYKNNVLPHQDGLRRIMKNDLLVFYIFFLFNIQRVSVISLSMLLFSL
jgi:hypothetical protein